MTPPATILDLAIIGNGDSTLTIQWTAPGDDGHKGKATSYDIRWSHTAIMGGSFSNAFAVAHPPAPEPAGTVQQLIVTEMDTTRVSYLAMTATDDAGNVSTISNGVRWMPYVAVPTFKDIPAVKDNSIYEEDGTVSNGAGPYLITGSLPRQGRNALRRALIAFAVADSIPAGAGIDSVVVRMHVSATYDDVVRAVTFHRVTADWGEGTANSNDNYGADGVPAGKGDTTWLYRFFDTAIWGAPGGDIVASASATRLVRGGVGIYTWKSTPQLISDVQGWLDTPSSNFGWAILCEESAPASTAKGFDSREGADMQSRPMLRVFYTVR